MAHGAQPHPNRRLIPNRMATNNTSVRTLSLDVRSAKFGFVVFEGSGRLCDFGVRRYAQQSGLTNAAASKNFLKLVYLYLPSLIVIGVATGHRDKQIRRARIAALAFQRAARRRSILSRFVSRRTIKEYFQTLGPSTKHEIASYLAERFPDLSWKQPLKRKPWQPEPYQMPIFDAAASGLTFLSK